VHALAVEREQAGAGAAFQSSVAASLAESLESRDPAAEKDRHAEVMRCERWDVRWVLIVGQAMKRCSMINLTTQ
jgi:hypothetical protein